MYTIQQYDKAVLTCEDIFIKKTKDYGTSWRVYRTISVVDQIYIKAKRIRTIQEKGVQKVGDPISDEFIGIINYCVIALLQIEFESSSKTEMSVEELETQYDNVVTETFALLQDKNHDYGEAWREMRVSSITDIILMKLLRVKQIEDNQSKTLVSEGVKANYQDMINYAVFALILLSSVISPRSTDN